MCFDHAALSADRPRIVDHGTGVARGASAAVVTPARATRSQAPNQDDGLAAAPKHTRALLLPSRRATTIHVRGSEATKRQPPLGTTRRSKPIRMIPGPTNAKETCNSVRTISRRPSTNTRKTTWRLNKPGSARELAWRALPICLAHCTTIVLVQPATTLSSAPSPAALTSSQAFSHR